MDCKAVKELLWAYLKQETTAEESVKIEEHLKTCGDCREELDLQKEMMETLNGLPEEELPEGYHAELMQKLQEEAAPNVVPFPVRKKKQPMWKQWGMIAAAVLVVVAAGGMHGMLDMRKEQQAVVQEEMRKEQQAVVQEEMRKEQQAVLQENEKKDQDADFEERQTADTAVSPKKRTVAETASDIAVKPQKNTQSVNGEKKETKAAAEENRTDGIDNAAVPMVTHADAAEDDISGFSASRSVKQEEADEMTLLVKDTATAMAEIEKAIAEAGGFAEEVEAESVLATIPTKAQDEFIKAVEAIGTAEWTAQGTMEEDAAQYMVKIQLKVTDERTS